MLDRQIALRCVKLLLRPAVRFAMRHAVRLHDIVECLKSVQVEVAKQELLRRNQKPTQSRISVMTGLNRRDAVTYSEERQVSQSEIDLIMKVMGRWQTDKEFLTKAGEPRVLRIGFRAAEFNRLVEKVSKDLNPATILFELERINAVTKSRDGVKLAVQSYVPTHDTDKGLSILTSDMEDLAGAVLKNVFQPQELQNLHARTVFDRIRPGALPEIKRWLLREGHRFHAQLRDFLAQYDQDLNPIADCPEKTVQISVTSFSNVADEVNP